MLQLRKLIVNFIIGIVNTNIIKTLVVTRTILIIVVSCNIRFFVNVLKQVVHFGWFCECLNCLLLVDEKAAAVQQ